MKKLFLSLCIISLLLACSCHNGANDDSSVYESSVDAVSDVSAESSEVSKAPDYKEKYEFLKAEYSVSAYTEAFGTIYGFEFFLVDGIVQGARLTTTLPSVEEAEEYLESIIDTYPDAYIENDSVTLFLNDDDDYYYGYSLERLKFTLELTEHIYTVNFDEEEFYKEFPDEEEPEK